MEVSIAPDRAEAFRHVIPGPEAGRAAEALARLHRRTHPLDLEQPDVVPQVAMANQAPVVVGGKYQVVGIEGSFLCFIPTSGPVDHAQATGRNEFTCDAFLPRLHQAGRLDCSTQTGRCF